MKDKDNLFFVNKDNSIEFWNIPKNQNTENIPLGNDVFVEMKYIKDHIFFLNDKSEFVLWDFIDREEI